LRYPGFPIGAVGEKLGKTAEKPGIFLESAARGG
jgi:hypothetical protein